MADAGTAMHALVSQRFAELQEELQVSLQNIQSQVVTALQEIETDIFRHSEASDFQAAALQPPVSPDPVSPNLDTWVLKEAHLRAAPAHVDSSLSIGALILKNSASVLQEGMSSQPHFRLNSHLMELSQKAGEAVEITKMKTGVKSPSGSPGLRGHRARIRSATSQSEFDTCDSVIMSPNSKFRVGWDFASVSLIVLDAFLLPLTMAFGLDVAPFAPAADGTEVVLQIFAMTSLIFWPLDMIMSFNTGFYRKGVLQRKRSAESVFLEGALAEYMYITSHGAFSVGSVLDLKGGEVRFSDEHRYFAEVAMYVEAVMHDCTLTAESFSEVFLLSGSKLADILSHHPTCATMFVEYATEFVNRHTIPSPDTFVDDILLTASQCAKHACESNSYYLELHMDDRKAIRSLSFTSMSGPENGASSPEEFVSEVLDGARPTLDSLRHAFLELDPENGLHSRYSEPREQDRAESSILCLVALVQDDYQAFAQPQPEAVRLAAAQWAQLRSIVDWASPSKEKLKGAIFLLAIRGIGKFRSLTRQLPPLNRRPESAVRYILENYPDATPSIRSLDENVFALVKDFNFAQMLQGENVAGNLATLKKFMRSTSGEEILKFYVLTLLGFMSGLAGGTGSRFMTQGNAQTTIMGLNALKHILEEDPRRLYWTYVYERGSALRRVPRTSSDLAALRLACLCRIQTQEELLEMQKSWDALGTPEKQELCNHLLADGIVQTAIIFEFLPLCVEKARANPFVTVTGFLEVLVELIQAVRAASVAFTDPNAGEKIVAVDLADMAAFIPIVQNSYIFQTCLSRAKLSSQEDRFYLEITQENWRRVSEPHSDIIMLVNSVRELAKKQGQESSLRNSRLPPTRLAQPRMRADDESSYCSI